MRILTKKNQTAIFSGLLLLCSFFTAKASHLYGGELYYTHIGGNKYTVTMVLYGDCGGTASAFSALYSATPKVEVYKGSSLYDTLYLKILAGSGTEVTPVCAGSLGSTTCNGGTVPGVKKFTYSDTITLPPFSSWRLRSTGYLTATTSAGRSNSITNILPGAGTIMSLEATLNNSSVSNSSPVYTTIPTPFFCINVPQEYNQGAVDPDAGDSLTYSLVEGLDATTTPSSTVTYRRGYSATSPLASVAGTFSFSNRTGQLTFTPNLAQVSLVVCKVSEYRSGVLVGTSMREMNFIVLSTCSNHSPYGKISDITGGTSSGNTVVNTCKNDTILTFNINPVDSDRNNITMTVSGLPAGATLSFSGNGTAAPTSSFVWNTSTVAAGTYYFFITYVDDACPLSSKQTIAYTITIAPKPGINIKTITSSSCIKKEVFEISSTGSAPYNAGIYSGSTLLRTISWSTATQKDSLAPGTYRFRITNASGCYDDLNYTVLPPVNPSVKNLSIKDPLCHTSSDGSVTITADGGLAPYTYGIDGGTYSSSPTFSSLSGTHVFRIRDANSCNKDTSLTLINPPAISITSLSLINPLCNTSSDGTAMIVAAGSLFTPYTYSIDGGAFTSSSSFTKLAAGLHSIRIQDAHNCLKDTSFTLVLPELLSMTARVKKPVCKTRNDGSIVIDANGGSAPYTYAIGPSGAFNISNSFTGLGAGTYLLRIKDTHGCEQSSSVTLTDSIAVSVSISTKNTRCNSSADGLITVSPLVGTAPFTYAFGSGTFSSTATYSAAAGTYVIHIKDSLGCLLDTAASITAPPVLGISASTVKTSCYGLNNGSLNSTGSGGTAPYTYSIDKKVYTSSGSFTGLPEGVYTISVQDANGCTQDTVLKIEQTSKVTLAATITAPLCHNDINGKVTLLANGGAAPYTYSIDGGTYSSSPAFSSLSGTHIFRIRDANSCNKDTSITLISPPAISVTSLSLINPLCNTSSDGIAMIVAAGSLFTPYTYSIDGGAFTSSSSFTKLAAGLHSIRIQDAHNCLRDTSFTLILPEPLSMTARVKKPVCKTRNDGSIVIDANGGSALYTYAIGPSGAFNISNSFTGLGAGTYLLRIKDTHGCEQSSSVTLTDSIAVSVSISTKNTRCNSSADGLITVSPLVGTAPFTYAFGSGTFSSTATYSAAAGTYVIHIKDSLGCPLDTTASIIAPTALGIIASTVKTSCYGLANGSLNSIGKGGTAPYTYSIDKKVYTSSGSFTGLKEGIYTLSVKDGNGCIADTTLTLEQASKIAFTATITAPLCHGDANGTVAIRATGGTPAYAYSYDTQPAQTDPLLQSFKAGSFIIHVADHNGCQKDSTILVTEPDPLSFDKISSENPTCENYTDGSIAVKCTGGTMPYEYAIGKGNFVSEGNFKNLKENSYVITVRDRNHCNIDTSIDLKGYPKIVLDSVALFPSKCTGTSDGAFTLYASGGNAPLRYLLEGSSDTLTSADYQHLRSKSYSVTVMDAMHCTKDFTAFVPQPDQLLIRPEIVHNDCTGNDTNGSITVLVTGGTRPYTYLWSTLSNDSVIIGLPRGFYKLTITDGNNCKDSASIEVSYNNCCTPSIPNAFTPNNDGRNDIYKIIYRGDIILKEFRIYNRYGQCVFLTDNINDGWDGRFQGKEEEMGVYYYYVRLICGNKKDHEINFKGDVTLIR